MTTLPQLPPPCLLHELRVASRGIERLYDAALSEVDLTGSQFSILRVVARRGPLTQGQLGALLKLDSTSLSRMLAKLITHGVLATTPGFDRRKKILIVSQAGLEKLSAAEKICTALQAQIQDRTRKHSQKTDPMAEIFRGLALLTTALA